MLVDVNWTEDHVCIVHVAAKGGMENQVAGVGHVQEAKAKAKAIHHIVDDQAQEIADKTMQKNTINKNKNQFIKIQYIVRKPSTHST